MENIWGLSLLGDAVGYYRRRRRYYRENVTTKGARKLAAVSN
jgi:hypothetical protein